MVAYTIKGNDLCSFPFTVSLILLSSAAFSSRVFMTVPIFPSDTAHRVAANRTHIQQLQSFDARCDWLSLIYRGPGSVNFKLTDKKSTATIRTHRFFSLSLSPMAAPVLPPKMAITQQSAACWLAVAERD